MYHQDNPSNKDTIYAECSGYGKSAIKIFRITGPKSLEIIKLLNPKIILQPNLSTLSTIYCPDNHNIVDKALVTYFKSPRSFTGEDIIEINIHGSIAVAIILNKILLKMQILRPALPGEFSKRAFLNGKMDLTQAEGLSDLINAETELQHKQSINQLNGSLKNIYNRWKEEITKINANITAILDFPEEEIPVHILETAKNLTLKLIKDIKSHINDNEQGIKIKNGIKLAIIGPPNVGKSTLMNYLSSEDISITSSIAGTTRDSVTSYINIEGYPITLIDTAGIRKANDEIEKIGIEKSYHHAKNADIKIIMFDSNESINKSSLNNIIDNNTICIFNKIDINKPNIRTYQNQKLTPISLYKKIGLDDLKSSILIKLKNVTATETNSPAITRLRYKLLLEEVIKSLEASYKLTDLVLVSENLRIATNNISKITGDISVEEILSDIFSNFCIGK